MKENIHPDYHEITVVMTDGTKFKTRSTWGKEGDSYQLDVDPKTHPAWTGAGGYVNESASQVARFNKRFGNLKLKSNAPAGAAASSAKPAAAAPKKEAKKAEPKAKKEDKKA